MKTNLASTVSGEGETKVKFDATVNLEDVIEDPSKLDAAFEEASQKANERLWNDPEWSEPRFTMLKEIVTAFLVGTMNADAWFEDYSLPPNIETVGNALCGAVSARYKTDNEGVNLSLLDLQAFYREFIDATPLCREWNDFPGSMFVSSMSATPKERTFIDLDALVHNACMFIQGDRRAFDKFNADFDARHGQSE